MLDRRPGRMPTINPLVGYSIAAVIFGGVLWLASN